MSLGELSGAARQHVVEVDEVELLVPRLELTDGGPELATCQPAETLCLSEGSPCLGVTAGC